GQCWVGAEVPAFVSALPLSAMPEAPDGSVVVGLGPVCPAAVELLDCVPGFPESALPMAPDGAKGIEFAFRGADDREISGLELAFRISAVAVAPDVLVIAESGGVAGVEVFPKFAPAEAVDSPYNHGKERCGLTRAAMMVAH